MKGAGFACPPTARRQEMSGKLRRHANGASGSSRVFDFDSGPADEAAAVCTEWLTRHAEHEKLIRRWQRLETRLIHEHDLFNLSKRDRASLSGACELDAINARLVALYAQNQKLLGVLPALAATTKDGVVSKLSVALANVRSDESRAAHQLIKSVLRDFEAVEPVFGK
jgi:hypothetical protein